MTKPVPRRISTGIPGLDEILHGGYIPGRAYLLSGPPGGGKTTLGWHFLTAAADDSSLFITFGESQAELLENASYSGFDPSGVHFCDLSPAADLFEEVRSYDIFPAAEVELEPTTARLIEAVQRVKPQRVFIDSMTALRYLYKDAPEFRRQTLSFLRYVKQRGGCVVMTSETSGEAPDDDLRYLCDGVIELAPSERARSLTVAKFRGSDYHAGEHTLRLGANGATVFPRLMPEEHGTAFAAERLPWGIPELDALTYGGLERGTVTLLTGPSGVGKTTVGAQFMKEAAERGERSAIYTFDERVATLTERCESVGIPVSDNGRARHAVDRRSRSAQVLRGRVRQPGSARRRGRTAREIVMIDSISGYRLSVSDQSLNERLHALCRYLQNVGVTVLLVNELINVTEFRISEIGITYLADNVVMLRYVERRNSSHAEMGRVIGVLKKRLSDFEKTLRKFEFTPQGLKVGAPMTHLAGMLGGTHDPDVKAGV